MVHVPALLLARIPIFILYKVFCCCFCDDNEYNSDHDYKELMIHLDYVKFQLGFIGGGFENHQRGTQEIAWQRSMRLIRTRVEQSRRENGGPRPMMVSTSGKPRLRTTVFLGSMIGVECPICFTTIDSSMAVAKLPFNKKHVMLADCYAEFKKHRTANN